MARFEICSIEGCEKPVRNFRLGWCAMHIERDRRHGSPHAFVREQKPKTQRPWGEGRDDGKPKPLRDRRMALLAFLNEIVLPCKDDSQCIEWPFSFSARGYGIARLDGASCLVYVYACRSRHGEKPTPKHEAAHNCGNAKCVNPMHLRWATRNENDEDKLAHNGGQAYPQAKLTADQIREIRISKETQDTLAERYGIAQSTVSKIKRGERWKHLTAHSPSMD